MTQEDKERIFKEQFEALPKDKRGEFLRQTKAKGSFYKKMAEVLGYNTHTILRYAHNTPEAEAKTRERQRKIREESRKSKPLKVKLGYFLKKDKAAPQLTIANLLTKFGPNPVCYLTGQPIDLNDYYSYQLDHITPVSKGGRSTLENCGLTCAAANQAKHSMPVDEFIALCERVTERFSFI
jgi:5-methylcytosine-specific restriction endonuclease McrA